MTRATRIPCSTGGPIANLTVVIDDDVLKKARIRAVQEGTSVNALVRAYLEGYAHLRERQVAAIDRVLDLARESHAGAEDRGRAWKRQDLYDRGRW